jgi:hypothetical protein
VKSFVFCTSYFQEGGPGPAERWQRWLDYCHAQQEALGAERIVLIDDGSPRQLINVPVEIIDAEKSLPHSLPKGPVLFRFDRHLGRPAVFRFPGWWRSFTYAYWIATTYGYPKIIHLESDAFIMSERMKKYIKSLKSGWTAFWCPRYERPESAVQVICEDSFPSLEEYFYAGPEYWSGDICAETTLPFTRVDRTFIGDRYGEYTPEIPDDADYIAQTPPRLEVVSGKKTVQPRAAEDEAQRRPA